MVYAVECSSHYNIQYVYFVFRYLFSVLEIEGLESARMFARTSPYIPFIFDRTLHSRVDSSVRAATPAAFLLRGARFILHSPGPRADSSHTPEIIRRQNWYSARRASLSNLKFSPFPRKDVESWFIVTSWLLYCGDRDVCTWASISGSRVRCDGRSQI